MNNEESFAFEMRWQATTADADELGHVNNVVYLRWVQDVAAAHWNKVAPLTLQAQCAWVVLRHEIDYLNATMPGDEILGKTFIANYDGAKSIRIVHLYHAGTNKLLCKARTTWCLLDSQSFKPKRISEEIMQVLPLKP